jgi:maltooligosyltrehalose trehalohydrolase
VLAAHKALLALRRQHPELVDPDLSVVGVSWDEDERWLVVERGSLRVVANLADQEREIELDEPATGVLFSTAAEPRRSGAKVTLPAESAAVLTTR